MQIVSRDVLNAGSSVDESLTRSIGILLVISYLVIVEQHVGQLGGEIVFEQQRLNLLVIVVSNLMGRLGSFTPVVGLVVEAIRCVLQGNVLSGLFLNGHRVPVLTRVMLSQNSCL